MLFSSTSASAPVTIPAVEIKTIINIKILNGLILIIITSYLKINIIY
jgi:hypothetical protein